MPLGCGGSVLVMCVLTQGPSSAAPTSITVTASAPGLTLASYTIPLSVDLKDSVLAVASASVASADVGALEI